MLVRPPLQPSALYRPGRSNYIAAWGGDYALRETRDGRDTLALFGRPFTPIGVAEKEKRPMIEARINSMRESDNSLSEQTLRTSFDVRLIPDVRPAFDQFWIDAAGRTWVQLSQPDTTVHVFDLYDSSKRWLDVVTMSSPHLPSVLTFGVDRVAMLRQDAAGRPELVIWRIRRAD
jgi:hypothetical protein